MRVVIDTDGVRDLIRHTRGASWFGRAMSSPAWTGSGRRSPHRRRRHRHVKDIGEGFSGAAKDVATGYADGAKAFVHGWTEGAQSAMEGVTDGAHDIIAPDAHDHANDDLLVRQPQDRPK